MLLLLRQEVSAPHRVGHVGRPPEVKKGRGAEAVGASQAYLIIGQDLDSGGRALWRNGGRLIVVVPAGILGLGLRVGSGVVEGAGAHPLLVQML